MKAVAVRGLTYQYLPGGPFVLKDINFQANRGEIIAVTGLSGCGKTTLCQCISGTIRHNRDGVLAGEVEVNGKNIRKITGAKLALEVGIVFQDADAQLFSPTVEDEVAFGPENLCLPPDIIQERVNNVLDILGIAVLRYANPYRLSGGEKHLVALASVFALEPPVLILDEVMSQLDTTGRKKVAAALAALQGTGKTIIAVEHDLEAVSYTDRLIVLECGELVRFDRTENVLADRDFMLAKKLING